MVFHDTGSAALFTIQFLDRRHHESRTALKAVLVLVGLIFLFAVYPLMMFLWPGRWRW
jgi:hypothetical protein